MAQGRRRSSPARRAHARHGRAGRPARRRAPPRPAVRPSDPAARPSSRPPCSVIGMAPRISTVPRARTISSRGSARSSAPSRSADGGPARAGDAHPDGLLVRSVARSGSGSSSNEEAHRCALPGRAAVRARGRRAFPRAGSGSRAASPRPCPVPARARPPAPGRLRGWARRSSRAPRRTPPTRRGSGPAKMSWTSGVPQCRARRTVRDEVRPPDPSAQRRPELALHRPDPDPAVRAG